MVFKDFFKASELIVQVKASGWQPVWKTERKLLILPDPRAAPPELPGFTGRVSEPTSYVLSSRKPGPGRLCDLSKVSQPVRGQSPDCLLLQSPAGCAACPGHSGTCK